MTGILNAICLMMEHNLIYKEGSMAFGRKQSGRQTLGQLIIKGATTLSMTTLRVMMFRITEGKCGNRHSGIRSLCRASLC
jgi:hypothetical protein